MDNTIIFYYEMISSHYGIYLSIVRSIFNPSLIGAILVIIYILAWFKMEELWETKRKATNKHLLEKETDSQMPLSEYCDKHNGGLFEKTSLLNVLNHMRSKGKVPLHISELCQPVKTAPGRGIFWISCAISLRDEPRIDILMPNIRSKTNIAFQESLEYIVRGGPCIWKDPRSIFLGKESLVWFDVDFHDSVNFLSIYSNSLKYKRMGSLRIDQFLNDKTDFNFESLEIKFEDSKSIEKVKINDSMAFLAIALLFSHAEKR